MERTAATPLCLSFEPPAEGAPPVPMEQPLSKRPRPPIEAEQVRATPVVRSRHTARGPGHTTHSSHVGPPAPPIMGASRLLAPPLQRQAQAATPPLGMPYGRGPSRPGKGRAASAARPETETGWPSWAQSQPHQGHQQSSSKPQTSPRTTRTTQATSHNRTHLPPSRQAKGTTPPTYAIATDPPHHPTYLAHRIPTQKTTTTLETQTLLRMPLRPLLRLLSKSCEISSLLSLHVRRSDGPPLFFPFSFLFFSLAHPPSPFFAYVERRAHRCPACPCCT